MLLLNYDFYDIHSVLTMLRAKPEKGCNIEIIKAVLEILSAEQIGNTIESNIVRNKLKSIETVDKEDFQWVYVNNIYTYGIRVVKDENAYSFLAKGFQLLLEYAKAEEPQDREKAKGHLKSAIIGFVLIFVLMLALKLATPILQQWVADNSLPKK